MRTYYEYRRKTHHVHYQRYQNVPGKMVQLQKTKKEFEGHLTLVVFPFLKMSKKGPEQTAQEIGGYLKEHGYGFSLQFNLTIASDCWIELLKLLSK